MLEECATVDEAIDLFKKYNCPGLGGAHILIGDSLGNSVILEEGENNTLAVIRKSGNYQIATNFMASYLSDPETYHWIQCQRYDYIDQSLREKDSISVGLFRDLLYHVGSNRELSPTVYSNIYDFKSGKMYIYNYYNFNEVLILDIKAELKKEYRFLKLPELFSKLKAEYPADGDIVNSSSVEFRWAGDATDYEILISTDQKFTDPMIIPFSDVTTQKSGFETIVPLFLLVALLIGVLRKRKIILTGVLIILATAGCEDSFTILPETVSGKTHKVTIENLEAGKTYYWKVVAANSKGFFTETNAVSFSTCNF
jgi:hypothetical protein